MQFNLSREALLRPLSQLINTVERRNLSPILSNVLLDVREGRLHLTSTDLEVQMETSVAVTAGVDGGTTVPARKLYDIVRAIADGAAINFSVNGDKGVVKSGRSRFLLSTLPMEDFPSREPGDYTAKVVLKEGVLRNLLDRTSFAMANNDVRHYLNGLNIDVHETVVRCVGTDGHRLACYEADHQGGAEKISVIVPRKGTVELTRLLDAGSDESVTVEIGKRDIRLSKGDVIFTSKLVDAAYPDYERAIPKDSPDDMIVTLEADAFYGGLERSAILSNSDYRSVRMVFEAGSVRMSANNSSKDDAEVDVPCESKMTGQVSTAFCATYVLQAIKAIEGENVLIKQSDGLSPMLILDPAEPRFRQVVMPVRV